MALLLLRAAATVAAIILCITNQPVTAQTLHNSNLYNARNWRSEAAPSLATFDSYEDMNDYIANRNLRGLRKLDNPSDDSYIQAYNQHNEQPNQPDSLRHKRNNAAVQRKLPNEPKLYKFEISDAVEPSDAVKVLIKKHRSREMSNASKATTTTTTIATPTQQQQHKVIRVNRPKMRTKRMAPQQPANFKVQMIPFDVSDAKESDAAHKEIVKRMRSLESDGVTRTKRTTTAAPAIKSTNLAKNRRSRAGRSRRSAPEMIKFELEDAKEPDASMKVLLQQKQSATRESKQLKLEVPPSAKSTHENVTTADMLDSENETSGDQSSHESKRFFTYKEPPVKVKKSINSLPYEVQKVVTHLMKDNKGAKAYLKYLPAQKNDYNHFRSYTYPSVKYVQPQFGAKLQPSASFVKYYVPAQQKEQLQVQIHPVPVVEKVRYVYTPVAAAEEHAHVAYVAPNVAQDQYTGAIFKPIVVQDAGHAAAAAEHQQVAEVHHTYTADLSNVHHQQEAQAHEAAAQELAQHEIAQAPVHHVATKEFHASKPDPILEENKVADSGIAEQHAEAHDYNSGEHYKYAIYPREVNPYSSAYGGKAHLQLLGHQQQQQQQQHVAEIPAAQLIKIEYHAPPDPAKENYKELAEFKQLSQLMGKSPEDQIHGLTYLLAKEMQSKLHSQRQLKTVAGEAHLLQYQRPQDSTAPILFHPPKEGEAAKTAANNVEQYGVQTGHLIGMAKTKQYIPIVDTKGLGAHASSNELSQYSSVEEGKGEQAEKIPAPTSFVTYGLSPNYERGAKTYHYARPQAHYAAAAPPSVGGHHGLHAPVYHAAAAAEEHQHIEAAAADSGGVKEAKAAGGGGGIKLDHSLHIGSHYDDAHTLQYASKYAFGYRIRDFHTGNDFGHKQNRDLDGVTRGQYHILLPDGRIQNVIYHADDTGFHADVSFETGH